MLAYKTEGLKEEVEGGADVRRSPWLNLVIRASRGVLWKGDTRRLGLLVVFCNFLTSVHRRTIITVLFTSVETLLDHGIQGVPKKVTF